MSLARTFRIVGFHVALVAPALALAAGCGQTDGAHQAEINALSNGDAFVAIDRPLPEAAQALVTQAVPALDAPRSFYLAIHRRELGQRYFLTAYAKDYFPGTVGAFAAASLGVRVVTFREQNGKLFVFDASNNFATSDTFDPTLILEAYPIVRSSRFDDLAGSQNYILFDPAAGLNRFGALSDAFAQGGTPAHVQIDLAFLQNFRTIADGVTFEEVFTGYSNDIALNASGGLEPNVFKASGTLGLSLRRYRESPDYVPAPLPPKEYYFRSDRHIVRNTGTTAQTPIKWNIHKGGKPITWLLSNQFTKLKDHPVYRPYDILGAVKRGVEGWNEVFGFQALEAKVASAGDSFADDDKNYLIYDADPTYGFAFADWRSNPNTGEVRGASVYFNGIWLTSLSQFFDDPPATAAPSSLDVAAAPPAHRPIPALTWGDLRPDPLCVLWAPTAADFQNELGPREAVQALPRLTKKEKFEAYIAHVITHEIGHTLGLRHNFKGSLQPVASTVMDYNLTQDRARIGKPQPYDFAAIRLLYDLTTEQPPQPFCTDPDVLNDPECSRFDFGANPLVDDAIPGYTTALDAFLTGVVANPPGNIVNRLLKWIRGGSQAQHLQAWNAALGQLKVPVDAAKVATIPGYAARVDQATGILFSRLYLDPANLRGDTRNAGAFLLDPPFDPQVTPRIIAELKANLVNLDSIRSYATRRITVAALKKLQLTAALTALVEARATIRASRPGLGGDDAVLTDELLSRIDAAVNSYFNP
ncbi:zinc-dependent metalloprotease [Pendulispora albinea]|uniref:Zinc-dependent metalloprotease n=1 Tax=Pendulispora albinea TaxID=2741071 RepID=A0ABZ2M8F6_9BACT